MRRFVAAVVVVLVAFAFAVAEEFNAVVTKVEGNKVSFKKFEFGKKGGGKAEEMTLPLAANAKFMKAKFNKEEMKTEADGEFEGGKEAFEKRVKEALAKKPDDDKKDEKKKKGKGGFGFGGVFTQIITEGEGDNAKITEIRVFPAFKGKKKDAN
jgi:hypothetical protein